jgi:hypothetical protein
MAQIREFHRFSSKASRSHAKNDWKILILLVALAVAAFHVPSARAQLQQPLVFSSSGAVASRNDQTGALTAVSGSPFITLSQAPPSPFTLDVQGRFLFALGTNGIRMFQITNSTTGAYQEVANSPFASSNTNQPTFIAVEPTGKYIAVVNRVSQNPGEASVETFQISTTGSPSLVPVTGSITELDSTPVGAAQPPDNTEFLIFMGPNPQSQNSTIQSGSEFQALSIDPQSGMITGLQANTATAERGDSFAMDPQGRYYVLGTQDNTLQIGNLQIFGIAGQLPSSNVALPEFHYPVGLWIDSTGSFLYVATTDLNNPTVVNIYSVNLQTGALTEMTSSPLPNFSSVPPYYADPTGSFNFGSGSDPNAVTAYTVDPLTGYFVATANSPFTIAQIAGALTFSLPPGQQGVTGPSASLSATSLSFGDIQTGSTSSPQTITLTNNGGEALSVNSLSLTGADPSQFTETDTCQAPSVLQPNKFCSINVTFAPTSTGSQQAALSVTDNAPGSPQSVQLSGAGTAPPPPAPAVTIAPNPVSFPSIAQGTTSSPITINVTNSGNATLHITSVTLGGNNTGDFSMTNGCTGAYAANTGCTITVTFTPLAAGLRSATISLSDDAANSPQVIPVSGMATAAPPTRPVVSLSTTSVSFGSITQGTAGTPQTVSVTNTGGAALHISSVALGGPNASDFSMNNGCTAASYAVNSGCTISVSFAPLLTGSRSATITLTDDAADSPQIINLSGTVNPAVTLGPAPNGSTSATITAGQSAQFSLQVTPGPGFTGTVSLTCSGAPLAATCSLPATVQVSNGNAAPFTVVVATTGAIAPPMENPPPALPFPGLGLVSAFAAAVLLFLLFALSAGRDWNLRPRRLAVSGTFGAILLSLAISSAGCGGGGSTMQAAPPPTSPTVTPQGTSMITVSPSAMSASGKPLQLQPIQLTLTVQ